MIAWEEAHSEAAQISQMLVQLVASYPRPAMERRKDRAWMPFLSIALHIYARHQAPNRIARVNTAVQQALQTPSCAVTQL